MRTKVVNIAGKDITIRELKIKEINELTDKLGVDIEGILGANNATDFKTVILSLLHDKLPEIFPGLTKDDIDEAYPSELEELIGGFVDTNFFGLKKVITPLLGLAQKK